MLGGIARRRVSSANLGAPQPLTREGKSAVRQENLANKSIKLSEEAVARAAVARAGKTISFHRKRQAFGKW